MYHSVFDVDSPRLVSSYVNVNSANDMYVPPLIASSTYVDVSIRSSVSDYTPDSPLAGKGKSAKKVNASVKVVEDSMSDDDGVHPNDIDPVSGVDSDVESLIYYEDTEPRGSVISHRIYA